MVLTLLFITMHAKSHYLGTITKRLGFMDTGWSKLLKRKKFRNQHPMTGSDKEILEPIEKDNAPGLYSMNGKAKCAR